MNRTPGRMLLLSLIAVVLLHGKGRADEESSLGRILEFQKKLDEKIDYELTVQTTLDKALDELLKNQGLPYVVNEDAFVLSNQDKDVIKKTEIDKIGKVTGVSRATILKRLLQKIPLSDSNAVATYVFRRDHVEITTAAAKIKEARGARTPPDDGIAAPFPPLSYAAFNDTPLQDALKELARTTDSTIVVDGRASTEAKTKVTAELSGVPLDAAVQLLADMASLKLVRVANVYYVTSVKNADALEREEARRRGEEPPPVPTATSLGLGLGGGVGPGGAPQVPAVPPMSPP